VGLPAGDELPAFEPIEKLSIDIKLPSTDMQKFRANNEALNDPKKILESFRRDGVTILFYDKFPAGEPANRALEGFSLVSSELALKENYERELQLPWLIYPETRMNARYLGPYVYDNPKRIRTQGLETPVFIVGNCATHLDLLEEWIRRRYYQTVYPLPYKDRSGKAGLHPVTEHWLRLESETRAAKPKEAAMALLDNLPFDEQERVAQEFSQAYLRHFYLIYLVQREGLFEEASVEDATVKYARLLNLDGAAQLESREHLASTLARFYEVIDNTESDTNFRVIGANLTRFDANTKARYASLKSQLVKDRAAVDRRNDRFLRNKK